MSAIVAQAQVALSRHRRGIAVRVADSRGLSATAVRGPAAVVAAEIESAIEAFRAAPETPEHLVAAATSAVEVRETAAHAAPRAWAADPVEEEGAVADDAAAVAADGKQAEPGGLRDAHHTA